MKVGTKSLLFGVHQFIWHPFTVLLAWIKLYGWPTWKEVICIIIHDWGYWGCTNIDGDEGKRHPEKSGRIAFCLFGNNAKNLCLYHSRSYALEHNAKPSKLCWADKMCIVYDPWWLYLPRARLSGELKEYRHRAAAAGYVPLDASDREWYHWLRNYYETLAREGHINLVINKGELFCV